MNGKRGLINIIGDSKIGLPNPELCGRAINRIYYTGLNSEYYNTAGEKFIERGRDNPVILEELVKVPWLVYQKGARKEISAGSSAHEGAEIDDEDVEAHLKELGYLS